MTPFKINQLNTLLGRLCNIRCSACAFIAILVVLAMAFYWFQLRPSWAYRSCHKSSTKAAIEMMKSRAKRSDAYVYGYDDDAREGWYLISDYENFYKECLRSRGLEN